MALPIAPTPTLTGAEAVAFLRQLHGNQNKAATIVPTPKLHLATKRIRELFGRSASR